MIRKIILSDHRVLKSKLPFSLRMTNGPELTPIPREKIWNVCQNHLQGNWTRVDKNEIIIKQMTGGLSNLLYHCALPQSYAEVKGDPVEVLLRFFGNHLQQLKTNSGDCFEHFIPGLTSESVVFTFLSERNLGPKLLGAFAGGRIEEYIPAKPLVDHQISDKETSIAIARELAKIHHLTVPINRNPDWLFVTLENWAKKVSGLSKSSILGQKNKTIAEKLLAIDYKAEIAWLKKSLEAVNSPIVFCHNDLQGGNILCRQFSYVTEENGKMLSELSERNRQLAVIDYEYCSYNFRAYDIANHFAEWCYDYGLEELPYFTSKPEKYPSEEAQNDFVRSYVESTFTNGSNILSMKDKDSSIMDDEIETILREVHTFKMVPHLLWGLWSMQNSVGSKIRFAYWNYAEDRIEKYFSLKRH